MIRKRFDEQEVKDLVRNAGTREAGFRMIMEEFKRPLYWHIRRMVQDHDDTDDILQNTFVKCWKSLEGFRGDSRIKTWLWRIAINEALTFLDQKKRRNFAPVLEIENSASFSHTDHTQFSGEDITRLLEQAIATLPDKQRLVFTMKYYDELTYEEMAEMLGGTTGSLKASFHHASKKIEQFLQDSLNPTGNFGSKQAGYESGSQA